MKNFNGAINFLILYFITIFLVLIFNGFKKIENTKKKLFVFIFFGFLAFLTAFRMHNIGSDTPGYVASFLNIARFSSPFECIKNDGMEPGFIIFVWLISRITIDPQALLIISSVIIYISTGKFVYKYVKNTGLFCCLFIAIMQFDFFMSAMRQSLAIAIMLSSFDFAVQKKPFKFILSCLLAFSFHYTSIIFIVVYPIIHKDNSKDNTFISKMVGIVILLFLSFFFNKLISIVMIIFPKYKGYLDAETFDGIPRVALVLKILVYTLLYFIPKIFHEKQISSNNSNVYIENLSYLNICTLLISMNAVALARFSNTFSMFATMCYANKVEKAETKDRIIMTITTLIAFGLYGFIIVLLKTPEWTTTFPIKLIFK